MGYVTDFKLSADLGYITTEMKDRLDEIVGYDFAEELIRFGRSCKWYDWEKDMRLLSASFPNVLFTLEGNGEENVDIWIAYFKGGKSQICKAKITFDECTL
jgi:hypothetical protein